MNIARARWLIAAALLPCATVHAQNQPPDPPSSTVWSVFPAVPTTQDSVLLRNLFTGCDTGTLRGGTLEVDRVAHRIVFTYGEGSDICGTFLVGEVFQFPIGQLPAGDYAVHFRACYPPEFGQPCYDTGLPDFLFSVTESGSGHHRVPLDAWPAQVALAAMLVLVAMRRMLRG